MNEIKSFKEMYKIIPEKESENFRIVHHVATSKDVSEMKLIDKIHGTREYQDFKEGTYLELRRKNYYNDVVMSDTPMEFKTNKEVIDKSNGNVLIAGLGIGAILLLIQEKEEVDKIIVVEKSLELINLISPCLPLNKKVKIIHEDIFEFETKEKFDTIYFDIWDNVCSKNYYEMKKLEKEFKKNLNKKNDKKFISSWRFEDCKNLELTGDLL